METGDLPKIDDLARLAQDLSAKLEKLETSTDLTTKKDAQPLWLALKMLERRIVPFLYVPEGWKDPYAEGNCPECGQKLPTQT